MKKLMSSFLLFIVLLPGIAKVFYHAYWKINQKVLTTTYCKNQDKPELECNGRCHLEETLGKIDDSNSEHPEKNIPCWNKFAEIFVYAEEITLNYEYNNPLGTLPLIDKRHFYYSNFYHYTHLNSIFHPPCIC